jgi:NADH:ubiquinone oxidoreductase subunit 5 (subunit L)/multisubunit Na+/H+ antiporter MnhA subunit
MLLVGLAADFPLLLVMLAAWDAFGSLEFETLFAPASLVAVRAANPALVGMLGYGIVLSALVRMAQFPLGTWVLTAASGGSWAAGWVSGLVLPAGVFVIVRSLPALLAEPATLSLLLGIGGLSAVLWGVVSTAQHDLEHAAMAFVAGTYGLLAMGIGAIPLSGATPVLFLAASLTLLPVALVTIGRRDPGVSMFVARSGPPAESRIAHPPSRVVVLFALASGMWGQEAVVSGIWDASRPRAVAADEAGGSASGTADDADRGPAAHQPLPIVLPLIAATAHLLLCFGLFRAWLSGRMRANPAVRSISDANHPSADSAGSSRRTYWGGVVVALALLAGPVLCLVSPRIFGASRQVSGSGALTLLLLLGAPGLTSLLALLALLSAWLLYAQPSPLSARLEESVSSLSRLGRRRFYVDEAVEGLFVWPVRALSVLARWIDRRLLPALVAGASERLSRGLARWLAPLQDGGLPLHGLTVFLVTAVIVLCLVSG